MLSMRRWILGLVSDTRGAVLLLVAAGMFFMIGMAGLALDSGRGYLTRLELTRAVDSAALTGARTLRAGQSVALSQARAAAYANGLIEGIDGAHLDLSISTDANGESTFEVTAMRTVPTTLMRLLGIDHVNVQARAVAAVPPVDLVLVIDQSGSLGSAGAWDDLQAAAKTFVREFDDDIDQLGLVSFQIRATDRWALSHGFTMGIERAIDNMASNGDTNTGEGLRLGREQFNLPTVRNRSAKVVVFFTDGRPTAFRGMVNDQDRMMAVYTTHHSGQMRGYFNNPDALPTDRVASPSGCSNATNCWSWTEPTIREQGRLNGLTWAEHIREGGIYVYSIGLGNPGASDPLLAPDMDYLRTLANEDGVASRSQPTGRAYFAPSAAELRAVFNQVAQDLLVRLAS